MAEILERPSCLVGGEWIRPTGPVRPLIDPYTESAYGEVAESGSETVDSAVSRAIDAYREWHTVDVAERAALLERVAGLLERDGERIVGLVSREMGMPVSLARVTQVELPASVLRATARIAREYAWEQEIDGATLQRWGSGVVAAITPWNMPVHQIVAKLAAALAAGCSVVLKPAESTPYDATALLELFVEAGSPPGLVNSVTGTGPQTGSALAGHRGVAHVSFTGSVRAGKAVARLAADNLTRCTLELGGKSPAVILPDADLPAVLPKVVASGLVNSGQACNAPTRIVVPHASRAEAEDIVRDAAGRITLGAPADPATQMGPLASLRQRDIVLGYIDSALAAGARLVTGTGKPSEAVDRGYFVDPTIVADAPDSARVVREEIFGPVLVLQTYTDSDDAVRIANDSDYGLSAEVWSGDAEHARRVASRLAAGQVKINGVRTRNRPAVPFGGIKASGYGRELGVLGLEEFTDVRAVLS